MASGSVKYTTESRFLRSVPTEPVPVNYQPGAKIWAVSETKPVKNNTQLQLELIAGESRVLSHLIEAAKVEADGWLSPMLIETIVSCAETLADHAGDLRIENIAENDAGSENYFDFIKSELATARAEWKNYASIMQADAEGSIEEEPN